MKKLSPEELRQYRYFSGISDGALDELSQKLEIVSLSSGSVVIRQGTPPDAFYFLKQGEVEVLKQTGSGQPVRLSVVSSGQGFGEVALLTCSHRSSSVVAKTDIILYRLSKKDFEDTIMMDSTFTSMLVKKIQGYSVFNRLKTYQPFALLEPEKMLALTDRLVEKKFAPGENIVEQGGPGDYYYVIKAGRVGVLVRKKNEQEQSQVAVLGEGESFGEEALIREQKRNATVRALEETSVLALDKKDFDRVLRTTFLEFVFTEDIEGLQADKTGQYVFLDARIPAEYEEEHIAGAVNIPMEVLRQKYPELDRSKVYFAYCTNESRGMAAAFLLRSQGFDAKKRL